MVKVAPNIPVIQTSLRITVIITAIRSSFCVAFDSDIFFTALVPKPKSVNAEIKPVVEVNNPTTPIPAGPNNTATNLERIIEIIKSSNSDVIGLIETYGSGAIIADSLGYYYYLISTNLSIMSRYPITETIRAYKPFNFGGVNLKISPTKNLVFFDTWLHYKPDYFKTVVEKDKSPKDLIADEELTRHAEIKAILKEIAPFLKSTAGTPVIMVGDFNVGSHLDWIDKTRNIHYNKVVEWPVSKEMQKVGFKDSYRELYINPLTDPGLTWTPRAATSSDKFGLRDRIDFIYYKGAALNPIMSKIIDYHPVIFPSDHAAVTTVFDYK